LADAFAAVKRIRCSPRQAGETSCSTPAHWRWQRPQAAAAQTPAEKAFRIDVHHHLSPPTYVTASKQRAQADTAAGKLIRKHDAQRKSQTRAK